jgi:hypothetical protein
MKNKTDDLLPKNEPKPKPDKLPGTIHQQFVRCGKLNCKCRARGELHGAYFYHFVRVGGKLTKRYLKPAQVEIVQAACAARQAAERIERISDRELMSRLQDMQAELRHLHQLSNLRDDQDYEKQIDEKK